MRRIFVPKRDVVRGEWRKLHNGEFLDLYCSPYIFLTMKSRRKGWAGNVTRMRRGGGIEGFDCKT